MGEREIREALDAKMDPSLVAYREQVVRIGAKVRRGEALTEGERGFVGAVLEDCAESLFNTSHFWLAHLVRGASTESEG